MNSAEQQAQVCGNKNRKKEIFNLRRLFKFKNNNLEEIKQFSIFNKVKLQDKKTIKNIFQIVQILDAASS